MDGVIKIVQGCSGSTNVPHVPQQINAGSCMAPREKKISEAEESQESDAKLNRVGCQIAGAIPDVEVAGLGHRASQERPTKKINLPAAGAIAPREAL